MTMSEILVHVESTPAGDRRLALARALAESQQARLVGIGEAAAAADGLAEWRRIHGRKDLPLYARYADLTVMGQGDAVTDMVMSVGRPILVVPHHGSFLGVGRHPLVAWNASREATRAVFDALPILRRAGLVTLMTLDAEDDDRVPGADISLALARHGVRVEVVHSTVGGIDPGNALLSRAADCGADLLVMGAYGHSPLREKVLGGATRHILDHMTVPVLLSH